MLGLEAWTRRTRTRDEIDREFEKEKWGGLLRFGLRPGPPLTLEAADAWAQGADIPILSWESDQLVESTPSVAHRKYRDLVAGVVERYFPATAIAELGAGYGSILIDIARRPAFRGVPMYAAELTESGSLLIDMLAAAEGVTVTTERCDLTASPITEIDLPVGSLIYTSYAAQYVPRLSQAFVESLIALAPVAVIHIEPCFEHCDPKTLLGLLRRRYIEVNDYNTNLVTILHEQRERGSIDIVEERPAVFGSNPLLAASIVVWRPMRGDSRIR